MIHEFKILLEYRVSGEECEGDGAIEMCDVQKCWRSMEDPSCTVISFKDSDSCTVKCDIKEFIDIWKACTEDIKI